MQVEKFPLLSHAQCPLAFKFSRSLAVALAARDGICTILDVQTCNGEVV